VGLAREGFCGVAANLNPRRCEPPLRVFRATLPSERGEPNQ